MPSRKNRAKSAYVVMPAHSRMRHIYEKVIHYVLEAREITRIQQQMAQTLGADLQQVRSQIEQADIVICDLTEESPAVIYQLGIAHALEKYAILISQTAANLPFSVRDPRIIQYEDTNIGLLDLRDKLNQNLFHFLTAELEDKVEGGQLDFPVTEQDISLQRKALYSNSAESRRFAIRFLGECQDKLSFPNIKQLATANEDPEMTREAFTALFKIDPKAARDVLLEEGLRHQAHFLPLLDAFLDHQAKDARGWFDRCFRTEAERFR